MKCKGQLSGPDAATGKICPEGWALYQFPGPQFRDVKDDGSANYAYYVWVDRYNTLGLGANVPIAETNGGESFLLSSTASSSISAFPIRLAFSARMSTAVLTIRRRAGRDAVWTTSGTRTVFHGERAASGPRRSRCRCALIRWRGNK